MAGRDVSVTREALGTVRVMKTTALMGEVVGMAAALCVGHGIDPRDVYQKHLGDLNEMQCVVMPRGDSKREAEGFSFQIDAPTEVYLAVHDRGGFVPPAGWRRTALKTNWSKNLIDTIYAKRFETGTVNVPGHTGKSGNSYGAIAVTFTRRTLRSAATRSPVSAARRTR